jgi:hypothetical protein
VTISKAVAERKLPVEEMLIILGGKEEARQTVVFKVSSKIASCKGERAPADASCQLVRLSQQLYAIQSMKQQYQVSPIGISGG